MRRRDWRLALLEWGEAHVSVCALLGALLLFETSATLLREGWPWPAFAPPMLLAAGLACLFAAVPWVWSSVPLGLRRGGIWAAWLLATAAAIGAMLPLEVEALAGSQLLLVAGVLAEMNSRPGSLRWFWLSLILLAAAIVLYYLLAPLRPVLD